MCEGLGSDDLAGDPNTLENMMEIFIVNFCRT